MSRKSQLLMPALLLTLTLFLFTPALWASAENNACNDSDRIAYQSAIEEGMPIEEVNAMFAHCREDAAPPTCADTTASEASSIQSADPNEKVIVVNNGVGSTFYEQMNGCGYHPQARLAACDVELKRTTWYGNFPGGSNEHVTFCFLCGGGWIPVPAAVHVTNNISAANPSYGFMAFAQAPNVCPGGGTGAAFRVRATLSWAAPAGNPCTNNPSLIWGNQISFDTRDDP